MYPPIKTAILNGLSDYLISAISLRAGALSIGSPCIIDINNKLTELQNVNAIKEFKEAFESNENISIKLNQLSNKCSNMYVTVVNLFPERQTGSTISASSNVIVEYRGVGYASTYRYTKTIPILLDNYKSEELSDINDNMLNDVVNNLNEYRYVNYIIKNIDGYTCSDIQKGVSNLVNNMAKRWPKHMCSYINVDKFSSSTTFDTLSMSFYKLNDVIPVFDKRNSDGICVEFILADSTISSDSILIGSGKYIVNRLLFSKSSDHIFTIDGENINRVFKLNIEQFLATLINQMRIGNMSKKMSTKTVIS